MKLSTPSIIALSISLVSCTTANHSLSETQVNFTSTTVPTAARSTAAIPTAALPQDRTIVFIDDFDGKSLDPEWTLLEGRPELDDFGLSTGGDKVSLQIDNVAYPIDFTIQFDLNQCGNDGYLQLTIGNQLQLDFLSNLSTDHRVRNNNEWQELPTGEIHRCAAHIVILFKSTTYIVLSIHDEEAIRILDGKINGDLHGPLAVTLTPYASMNNFIFTNP